MPRVGTENQSVEQFLDRIADHPFPPHLLKKFSDDLRKVAEELANDIREAAPVVTGRLRRSVRVVPAKNNKHGAPLQYFVVAGGPLTTVAGRGNYVVPLTAQERPKGAGFRIEKGQSIAYDYSEAVEFGTKTEHAHPFFYSTAHTDADNVKNEIEQAIERDLTFRLERIEDWW